MEYRKNFVVDAFKFWGGAKDTYNIIIKNKKLDEFGEHIEVVFEGTVPTETEINDYVWFHTMEILEACGIGEEE